MFGLVPLQTLDHFSLTQVKLPPQTCLGLIFQHCEVLNALDESISDELLRWSTVWKLILGLILAVLLTSTMVSSVALHHRLQSGFEGWEM